MRKHVYSEIEIDTREISDDYNIFSDQKEHEYCRLFLRMFKAAMIKVDDFAVVVADGRGRWYYMGGAYQNEPYLLELFHSSMTSVFPAVAIMGRMMLMPNKVGEAFERTRIFPWFMKPRDLEGVILTDFQFPDSLDEGIRQMGTQLRSDVAKLCKRHMLVRRIEKPDFVELGEVLKIAPEYLEAHRDEMTAAPAELSYKIVSGPAKVASECEVTLEINCHSEEPLGKVEVRVKAPYRVMDNDLKTMLTFGGGQPETRQIRFKVKPKTTPFCPLEVLFTMDETYPAAPPFPMPLNLDVQE